ncbi:MAG: septum formation initiator family protein [Acidobacteriota bacterium]|nr:septum formation initiator family protein [Acidobacteriota bacterium]
MKFSRWKVGYATLVFLGAAYGLVLLRGPHGIPGLVQKRSQIEQLEKENQKLHHEIEEKRDRISRLRDNPADQELEIRQRLKLVKPGEKVFVLQDRKPDTGAR